MALYGTIQRNDAVQNAPSYGGMFARNDAPQASASQASAPAASSQPSYGGMFARNDAAPSTPSPGMSETGYGRYGSRPRRDGGAWQGSRPGGTTGAIGGVRGGWGGAGGGWGQPSVRAQASPYAMSTPEPSVIPGIKSGPDEYGGAPAQTPSVQFNTPWQRLGVSGYGAGNAAQGAFSEQTGQVGAPAPTLVPARSMPSFMPSPFVGPTYGQPMPSVSDAGGIYGPGAVPTGMSSRYARQPVMRTLY